MTDHEVERALGYTPCVCGLLDGTWHPKCYRGKTDEQIAAGYKRAFAAARRHLKKQAALQASQAVERSKTPNAEFSAGPAGASLTTGRP
ncbi:MAG: hypothetical protein AMXMBFR78_34250 [Rubrivivax sp.]